ncbi:MAG: hypothetical protein AAF327_20315 [Cyanobacteria bacterium P01_A01_bin.37]
MLFPLTIATFSALNYQWLGGGSVAMAHSGHSHTQDSTQETSKENAADQGEMDDGKSMPMSNEHHSDGLTIPSPEMETDEQSSEQLIHNTQPVQVAQADVNLSSGFAWGFSESIFVLAVIAPFLLTTLKKRLQS